jgi:hypothetical protein
MPIRGMLSLLLCTLTAGCGPQTKPPGPFSLVEEAAWREVNRNHRGRDGIYVQAELRTFAYEIASAYAKAEEEGLGQEQLEYRFKQLIYSYIDGTYPVEDGTDINNLYFQYLVYVNPSFNPKNPLQKQVFDNWRAQYVRQLVDKIYDPKQPVLRNHYDERWGLTLYSRLVFIVYLNNEESNLKPEVADIGARTFLVDEAGNRYVPSGLVGPYLYGTDRPDKDVLEGETVYRIFFPNRKADHRTPIITPESRFVVLEIEGLGEEPTRRMRWELPLSYPELPQRRLPSEAELSAQEKKGGIE